MDVYGFCHLTALILIFNIFDDIGYTFFTFRTCKVLRVFLRDRILSLVSC